MTTQNQNNTQQTTTSSATNPGHFKNFTNKFSLTKTLRFELKRYVLDEHNNLAETKDTTEAWQKIEQKERELNEARSKIKPLIDKLHQEFISHLLSEFKKVFQEGDVLVCKSTKNDAYKVVLSNDFDSQVPVKREKGKCKEDDSEEKEFKIYSLWYVFKRLDEGDKDERKKMAGILKETLKALSNKFKTISNESSIEKNSTAKEVEQEQKQEQKQEQELEQEKESEIIFNKKNLLNGESLIQLLTKYYVEERKNKDTEEVISKFYRITGALSDLAKNREHYYEAAGKHGQVTTRIFNENLKIFLQNKLLYEKKIKEHYKAEDESIFNVVKYFTDFIDKEGTKNYNEKIADFNQKWNEVRQQIESQNKKLARSLPKKLNNLYKHIGEEKEEFLEAIDSFSELIKKLNEQKALAENIIKEYKDFWDYFKELLEGEESLDKIFIKKTNITKISKDILIDWQALNSVYCKDKKCNKKKKLASLKEIKEFIDKVSPRISDKETATWETFKNAWLQNELAVLDGGEAFKELAINDQVSKKHFETIKDLLKEYDKAVEKLSQFESVKETIDKLGIEEYKKIMDSIRGYLERINFIIKRVKVFGTKGKNSDLLNTENINEYYQEFYQKLNDLLKFAASYNFNKAFNLIRNFLRKEEKDPDFVRIYYSSAFLGGWDVNKIGDKYGFYIKDGEENVYLSVVNIEHAKDIANLIKKIYFGKEPEDHISSFSVLALKTMGDPAKDMPTLFEKDGKTVRIVGKKDNSGHNEEIEKARKKYWPDYVQEIYKKYGFGKELTRDNVGKEQFDKFVDYFKERLNQYHQEKTGLTFAFKPSYESWEEFKNDVVKQAYDAKWVKVNEEVILDWIKNEKIYLFRICNKDLCRNTKNCSIWDTQTIIFKNLFSKENQEAGFPVRLLGEAKVLLRDPKSEKVVKEKNGKILKKEDGTPEYKEQRYTEKKLMFHFAVGLNALSEFGEGDKTKVNGVINKELIAKTNLNIIGIDRGEKHLLYEALIDEGGKLKEAESLNTLTVSNKEVNFKEKLKEAENKMNENTLHWLPVGSIAQKKEGYLSHVINKLLNEVLENNAIIVLEDLNFGFARRRGGQFKVSVYQQFQKKLLQKLAFALNKKEFFEKTNCDEKCPEILKKENRCYKFKEETLGKLDKMVPQLTEDDANIAFSKLEGQHGIVLFVESSHTSTTCPKCGWFKENQNVHFRTAEATIAEYQKYDFKIFAENDYYTIQYKVEYEKKEKKPDGKTKTVKIPPVERKINTNVDRWYFEQAKKKYHYINSEILNRFFTAVLTDGAKEDEFEFFRTGFQGFGLTDLEGNLFERIIDTGIKDKNTWKAFVFAINRVFAIRNHISEKEAASRDIPEKEQDFLHCPQCGFDTRQSQEFPNGDAVGAYNIALKGKIVVDRIKENPENPNTAVSKYDWMKFWEDKATQD